MSHTPALAQLSTAPIFNTRAVARDTGVPPDTFRAWERRYGIPRPQRTAGGHRLYSERDIAIIRWLRDRTEEGMNISHAVMLLMNMLEEREEPVATDSVRSFESMVDDIVTALARFDIQIAERVISEAFAIHPFETVLLSLIQPALVEIGERWHRGEISVAAEHFATEFVRRKITSLLNVFEHGGQRETLIIACAPTELHDIGILFASLFLVRRGWHVVYLGAQVPLVDLLATVDTVQPGLVCLSATTLESAPGLIDVAKALRQQYPDIPVGYGGRIFNHQPELRQSVPAVFLGEDARALADAVARLLGHGSTSNTE